MDRDCLVSWSCESWVNTIGYRLYLQWLVLRVIVVVLNTYLLPYCDSPLIFFIFFFFNDTATTEIYTLSLHDALPICGFWYPLESSSCGARVIF